MASEYFIYDIIYNSNATKLGIDKSSSWCFGLYVCPQFGLYSFDHWLTIIKQPNIGIKDQFGCRIMPDTMIQIIMNRGMREPIHNFNYDKHNAEPGPNNLIRRKIKQGYCIGHEGTIDYLLSSY